MKCIVIIYILSNLVSLRVYPQSKIKGEIKESKENYIIVGTPKLVGFNDRFIQLQAGKIAVNVLAKQKKYLLMFTATEGMSKKANFKNLEVLIVKKGRTFNLKVGIYKFGTKKKLLREVGEKNIEKRFLLLQIRKSMYELIFGKDYLKKIQEKVKRENKKDNKELQTMVRRGVPPKRVAAAIAQIISDIKLSKIRLKKQKALIDKENAAQVEKANELKKIKGNIRTAIKSERNKIQRDKTDREFRGKQKKKKAPAISSDNSRGVDEKAGAESKGGNFGSTAYSDNPFEKLKRPRGTRLFAEFATLNRNSSTNYILNNVQNNFLLWGFKGTARVEVFPGLGDDFVVSLFYLTSAGDVELNIPDIKNFQLMYLSTAGYLPFDLNFGFHYENQYFINLLADDGSGLQVVENQFVWLQFGIERVFKFWKLLVIPQLAFSKNVTSQSNLAQDVRLDGTKLEFGGELGYKNYRVGFKYMLDSVTATNLGNFKTDQTSSFLTISYVFM